MYRYLLVILLSSFLSGSVFQRDCVACHNENGLSLERIFYRYVLTFSTELSTKVALKDYLNNPLEQKSLLSSFALAQFGVKESTKLSDEQLDEALDEYWEKFTFIGKIE